MNTTAEQTENKEYVVISTFNERSVAENKLVGEALKLKFPVAKDAPILTTMPSPEEVEGKTVIGSLIPTYIAQAADEVVEANTSSFRRLTPKMRESADAEDIAELLNFERSYTVHETDVSRFKDEEGASV